MRALLVRERRSFVNNDLWSCNLMRSRLRAAIKSIYLNSRALNNAQDLFIQWNFKSILVLTSYKNSLLNLID